MMRSIWPATRSLRAGAVPRYGTYCSLMPVMFSNRARRCGCPSRRRRTGGGWRRLRLHPGQQFRQGFGRDRILADNDHRVARQQNHRLQIRHEVIAELVDGAIGNMGAEMADADSIAVRGRANHASNPSDPAAPVTFSIVMG